VIAPEANAAFVANMEDVLEVYQRPRDPERPVVCLDETSKQLILETRTLIPATPGKPARDSVQGRGVNLPTRDSVHGRGGNTALRRGGHQLGGLWWNGGLSDGIGQSV
jgi:hypothetical protein